MQTTDEVREPCQFVGDGIEKVEHGRVQLWEGGPFWAETNIGADQPWESGYYFWWGDTIGYKREQGEWVASDGSSAGSSFDDENTLASGKATENLKNGGGNTASGVFDPERDVAQVKWGGTWRMPTPQEMKDLCDKCDWNWTMVHGVIGYIVRGRGDYASNSIFLPCAGYRYEASLYSAGSFGTYRSSGLYSGYNYTCGLYFHSRDHGTYDEGSRNGGEPVRPVQGFTK